MTGVYYGYAQIYCPENEQTPLCEKDGQVLPMVMSLGWNPFYKNEHMTAVSPNILVETDLLPTVNRKYTFCTSSNETSTGTK